MGEKYGYINKKGEWIVKPELEQMFHDAFYFREGRAVFARGINTVTLIDQARL